MSEIKLPPLPFPNHAGPSGTGAYFDSYTEAQLRAYATEAVEADREQARARIAKLEASLAGALREIEILKVSAELYARHVARDMLTAHPVIFSRSEP